MVSNNPRLCLIPLFSRFCGTFPQRHLRPSGATAGRDPPALPARHRAGVAIDLLREPTGAPGEGGKAASPLGVGRKGLPSKEVKPGQTVQLCDIEGPGTIRHLWLTTEHYPAALRGLVLRAWWEGQQHPSIECPVGDFFGMAHGKVMPYCSAVHSVGPEAGMNIWLPMPFSKRVKFDFTNETDRPVPLFYQITYTLGDKHAEDVGRLHTLFRRENPTTLKKDFELLPLRKQKGRYIGSVIGIRNLHPDQWWGEGEIKVYMDGDKGFPTICGTGSEDYVGLSWGVQQTPFPYNGCQPEPEELRVDVPLAPGGPDCLAAGVPHHDPADRLEEWADGDPGRLVVRDVLVRAGTYARLCRRCPT